MNLLNNARLVSILTFWGFILIPTFYGAELSQATTSEPTCNKVKLEPLNEIAQVSPLYGCWRLTFHNGGGAIHKGTLVMNGYSGTMRVRYFSLLNKQTEVIDETMRLTSSASGILIAGYDPVWAGTNIRHSGYSPDNVLFSIEPNGQYTAANCGDNLDCSPIEVRNCK